MRIAFVLSGGASLGASQAGMLQALYEHGIRPDLLVGTSAGAINAAFIASRPPTPNTAGDLQRLWRGIGRADVFPANPVTAGLGMLGLRDYSVSSGSLRRLVLRHLELDRLEDAPVELHVVAADALSGEEVLLSSGPAIDAVLASAAIPGVFPAVQWQAQRLVDGERAAALRRRASRVSIPDSRAALRPSEAVLHAALVRTLRHMEAGAIAGRDDLLRRDIALLFPDQFEQLVFELAHRENPKVRRLVHPDGGADTLLPATGPRKAEV